MREKYSEFELKPENKKTLEQVEIEHTLVDERLNNVPTIFGFINNEWLKFKKKIQDGDEIYEVGYQAGPLCGMGGIGIVREGKMVDFFRTWIS